MPIGTCDDDTSDEGEDCGEIFSKAEKSGSCGLVTLECRDRGSQPVLYWKLLDNLFLNYFHPK